MKRIFDFIFSLVILVTLSPILTLISLMIFIIDGKPILFVHKRIGKNGIEFNILKFRTMKIDTSIVAEKRITKLGNFLRKSSLDEVPNFINVIFGQMSIVGPRPLPIEYLGKFDHSQMKRHLVKPGITGWAQINGRNLNSWNKKFELDLWYVNNQNFFLDIKIIFLTIKTIISQKGINNKHNKHTKLFENHNEKSSK